MAEQFILEEIEAASQGNILAIEFARNSGYTPEQYKGAMNNSCPEIDGHGGPQPFFLELCLQLKSDKKLMVKFRIKVADKIMKNFHLGKYDDNDPELESTVKELHDLLQNEEVQNALNDAQLYGRVSILQSAHIEKVNELVNKLSEMSGKTPEEIFSSLAG